MRRIFGYALGSTAQGVQKVADQEATIRAYCRDRWPGAEPVLYIDPAAVSNLPFTERNGGRALNASLRQGDVIVFSRLDRGFRTFREIALWLEEWARRGIHLHVVDLKGKSVEFGAGPETAKVIEVVCGLADFDSEMASIRTRESLSHRKYRGQRHGRDAGYGMKWRRVKGVDYRVRDDEERAVMARIVAWRNESPPREFGEIHQILLEEGVTTTKANSGGKPKPWSLDRIKRAHKAELTLQLREAGGG